MTDAMTISAVTAAKAIYEQGTMILSYSVTYPEFSSARYRNAASRMNMFYRRRGLETARVYDTQMRRLAREDYKNSVNNGFPVHPYECAVTFSTAFNEDCVVSLYADRYEYTGGAHGNTARTSETWDLRTGARLSLDSLFPRAPGYRAILAAAVKEQIALQISRENNTYFDDYLVLVDQTFDPRNFYLVPGALAVYFQQYDIAPYVSGIPVLLIPFEDIGIRPPNCSPQ